MPTANYTKPYRVTVTQEGDMYLARVSQEDSYDQREGTSYKLISVALASTPALALADAAREAFDF